MKKLLLSLGLFGALSANAQLPNNSVATNFTITAHQPWLSTAGANNNGTYNLNDYLDRGYTVILDLSATWCGPCYSYHNQHVLDELWKDYGVAGEPGVSVNTQDKVLVLWIDVDAATADATILDGNGTIGNWLNTSATPGVMPATGATGNVMFPMANPGTTSANQIAADYELAYYPTIYRICPNRNVSEIGQLSYSGLVSSLGVCNTNQLEEHVDLRPVIYTAETEVCIGESYTPSVKVYNQGTVAASNITVNFKRNGNILSSATVGSLAALTQLEVTGSAITGFSGGALDVEIVCAADAVTTNNSLNLTINEAIEITTRTVSVNITLDNYGAETGWYFRDLVGERNLHLANFGSYQSSTGAASFPQPPVSLTLQPNSCYEFYIADRAGDGICCGYGQGSFNVTDANGRVLVPYSAFSSDFSRKLFTVSNLSNESVKLENSFTVYPNPATDRINISFEGNGSDYSISVLDLQGREVYNNMISGVDGEQKISVPTDGMSSGSYIVSVKGADASITRNIVVR